MKSSHLLAFATLLGLAGTASAAWTRLPYSDAKPVDLAAKAIPGTKIIASKGVENAANLLPSDPSASAHISGGKSEVTLQLINQQVLDMVTFTSDGVEGKVSVAGSPDEKNWTTLGREVFTGNDRIVSVSFASAQAKYVSISFESAQGGTVRGLHIYGTSTSKDFSLKPSPSGSGGGVNLAGGPGGARAIYAFPSPSNAGELGAKYNVFKFPNTGDKYRIIVYDLGASRTIREFSTAYSQHPVRLEVFAFNELPEKKDWRGKMTLDPAIFNETRPVAMGEDARGVGHIKVVPSKPVVAQFIALRFEPNYLHAASNGSMFDASWSDLALGSAAPILDAFNLLPRASLVLGDSGGFMVTDVNIGGSGVSVVPGGGGTTGDQPVGTPGTTSAQSGDSGSPPFLPGTPGAPAASSGGLPLGSGSGTPTNITTNPVDVTVSGAGGTTTTTGRNGGTTTTTTTTTGTDTDSNSNPPTTLPPGGS